MKKSGMSVAEAVSAGYDFTERNRENMIGKWGYTKEEADEICNEFKARVATYPLSDAMVRMMLIARKSRMHKGE